MPQLMPENEDALELWFNVKTQWRSAGGGLIGLDYGEVRIRARELDIDMSPLMWRKLKMLESSVLQANGAG